MPKIKIAVVNDMHCGSTVALCPPEIRLDDGGFYGASKPQHWLWQSWGDYWQEVDEDRQDADQFGILLNGDVVDGDHHDTPQILSRHPEAQAAALREALAIPLALKPDFIVVVRGTEVHVGNGGSSEEGLARRWRDDGLPVIGDPEMGTASWWHTRLEVDGVLIDATHHGRTGHREHTRANAAALHAHDIYLSHAKRGDRPPDLCLRAHFHRFNDSYDAAPTRVVTNGAWQLKTGYVHKKHADTMADIGGLIVTVQNGKYDVRKIEYKAERGPVCKIA